MEIKNKLSILKGRLWYVLSFILITSAFVLLEITEILPSFVGTRIVIYAIILALFIFAVRAKENHDKQIKNANKRKTR